MKALIQKENIRIRPATLSDKRKIFEWLTNSNLTREMMGPPKYPDSKIPSWEEFDNDYADHYFTGSDSVLGHCFIILYEEKEVGQINHNAIDLKKKLTDLDIWLCDKKYTGKGIGSEAILLLCEYLNRKYNCEQILIAPSKRNEYAIKAYEKAGFVMTDSKIDPSEMDYEDTVVLIKKMKNPS